MVRPAALAILFVGCGGGSKDVGGSKDGGGNDSGIVDLANDGCTQVATWPGNAVTAASFTNDSSNLFDYQTELYGVRPTTGTLYDQLEYDFYHKASDPPVTLPHQVVIPSNGTDGTCYDCVSAIIGIDSMNMQTTGTLYFALAGNVTATALDHGGATGTVAATGTSLHLVEWQMDNDAPVVNGKCIDVSSFSFSGQYNNDADGGT